MTKKHLISLTFLLTLLFGLMLFSDGLADDSPAVQPVNIYFFWGDGCPHCATEKPVLEFLASKYPQVVVHDFEVYYSQENQAIMKEFADVLGFDAFAVPITIIGDKYWIGFRDVYQSAFEEAILGCLDNPCEMDPGEEVGVIQPPEEPVIEADISQVVEPGNIIEIPILGSIDLDAQSLVVSTAIISFVDGFNPCSLWVLSVLLAITLHSGSRTKIITVGLTFLLVTSLVYSLFIAGVFTLFSYVGYLKWIQMLVAFIAVAFGLVNIKDYLWYKEGVSFSISDKHKPKLYQNMRSTVVTPRSLFGLIGSTAALAIGVSLISFACTAGFPVIWSNLVIANNVGTWSFILLLGLYMLIYLLDELAVFGAAVVTMKASKIEEKHGRVLKLVSGMIILVLGVVMAVNPQWMNQIGTSLQVFAVALAVTWAVYIIHQKILPRFDIYIGSGFKTKKKKKNKRH